MSFIQTFALAAAAGIIPALIWLWFWIREDRKHPEPKRLIVLAFIGGAVTVVFVIPPQYFVASVFSGGITIVLWAAIEEVFKVIAAYITVLRNKEMDEPIDAVVYMITVALGFAALESTLFLVSSFSEGLFLESILTGNFRFIGAMLLHTLSSATVGIFMALAFYSSTNVKRVALGAGILLAIVLHTLFNFFIINSGGEKTMAIFLFVWIGIITVILLFEHIKRLRNPRSRTTKTTI